MPLLDMPATEDIDIIAAARLEAGRLSDSGRAQASAVSPEIPGYDLIGEIGRGGQGVVYEAIQRATGRRVAVKVMRDAPAAGSERRHRFEREVRLLARLNHPALVAVHDSGERNGCFYSVMEFVEGTPIDEFVHGGSLPRRETLELFARVCDAVHAAHQRGVIHRDLKPANILVDEAGGPHVLDFGLAKLTPESAGDTGATAVTDDGRVLGTMAWASPEQVAGRTDDIDVRTDVYSLGVILYELLTGKLPYEAAASIREALELIAEQPPTPPSRLDRSLRGDLETIALKCLAKERERRYGTVAEVAADVRRHLAGEAVEARRDSGLYVMRKTMRRYRVPISIGVASMLGGFGFGAVMAGMYQQEAKERQEAVQQVHELREELQQLKAKLVKPDSWVTTFHSAEKLRELDPDEGLELIRTAWAEAADDASARRQMLKATNVADHPRFVQIMDLGMRDPSPEVQQSAINFLSWNVLKDFALDFGEYEAWFEKSKDFTLSEVRMHAAAELVEQLRSAAPGGRAALFDDGRAGAMLVHAPEVAAVAGELGMHLLLIDVLDSANDEAIGKIGKALSLMDLDEEFVRQRVVPLLEDENEEVTRAAVDILERRKATYAVEPLMAVLRDRFASADSDRRADLWMVAGALGQLGDPRVIPEMIAMIDADDTYDSVYGIGYFGLYWLTGVEYDQSHDGLWWREWWEKNRERFAEAKHLDVPALDFEQPTPRPVTADDKAPAEQGGETIEQSLLAGGDPMKRYFLYGPKATPPEDPRPLLLIMPGGDGSAEFKPFITNIWRQTAPEDMLVAQLVAPRWGPEQFDNVVWPIAGLPWAEAAFTTEELVSSVVEDIDARYDVDRSRVWILAWSSGGPAAYAALLDGPATGAIVAMSVFKPDQLGDLSRAAGKSVYILHSPQDFIPMPFPESARDVLAANGARTRLQTYEGGHGWHGDVFAMIRHGLAWLEDQAPHGAGANAPSGE